MNKATLSLWRCVYESTTWRKYMLLVKTYSSANPSRFLSAPDSGECLQKLQRVRSAPRCSRASLAFWSARSGALTMLAGDPEHYPCYGGSGALLERRRILLSDRYCGSSFDLPVNATCNTALQPNVGSVLTACYRGVYRVYLMSSQDPMLEKRFNVCAMLRHWRNAKLLLLKIFSVCVVL